MKVGGCVSRKKKTKNHNTFSFSFVSTFTHVNERWGWEVKAKSSDVIHCAAQLLPKPGSLEPVRGRKSFIFLDLKKAQQSTRRLCWYPVCLQFRTNVFKCWKAGSLFQIFEVVPSHRICSSNTTIFCIVDTDGREKYRFLCVWEKLIIKFW